VGDKLPFTFVLINSNKEGGSASLHAALEKYSTDPDFIKTTEPQHTQDGRGTF
jgi:hypothetical protein